MGDRGAANEAPTADDIAAMADDRRAGPARRRARVLDLAHADPPIEVAASSCRAPTPTADELFGIADALRRAGHGVFQFAPDHALVPRDEWPWMNEIARRTGRTVSVNLNQPDEAPDLWRDVLGLLDEAQADGHADRRPGRRSRRRAADVPGGQLQPAGLPPGLRTDLRAAPRRARRRAARSRTARPARRVPAAPAVCSSGSSRRASTSAGRSPTATSTTNRPPRTRSLPSPPVPAARRSS